ncbi:hypothetical protein BU15DRAFT_67385 [Melanogaster broomeanus]|nr:hypothetical protein BU15DRAFT_67385 [Melanogaster broomeanus]
MSSAPLAAGARELMQAPLMGSFIALVSVVHLRMLSLRYHHHPDILLLSNLPTADDHVFLKFMVLFLWTLETIHSGLNISFINHYLIDSFGDVDALLNIPWDSRSVFSSLLEHPNHRLITKQACFQVGSAAYPWTVPILVMLTAARFGTAFFNCVQTLRSLEYSPSTTAVTLASVFMITTMTIGIINDTLAAIILALHLEEGRCGLVRYKTSFFRLEELGKSSMLDCLVLITDYDVLAQLLASKTTLTYLALLHILMKGNLCELRTFIAELEALSGRSLGGPVDMSIGLSDFRAATFNTGQAGRDTRAPSIPHVGREYRARTTIDHETRWAVRAGVQHSVAAWHGGWQWEEQGNLNRQDEPERPPDWSTELRTPCDQSAILYPESLEGPVDSRDPSHRNDDIAGEDDARIRSGGVDDVADDKDSDSDGNGDDDRDSAGNDDDRRG